MSRKKMITEEILQELEKHQMHDAFDKNKPFLGGYVVFSDKTWEMLKEK